MLGGARGSSTTKIVTVDPTTGVQSLLLDVASEPLLSTLGSDIEIFNDTLYVFNLNTQLLTADIQFQPFDGLPFIANGLLAPMPSGQLASLFEVDPFTGDVIFPGFFDSDIYSSGVLRFDPTTVNLTSVFDAGDYGFPDSGALLDAGVISSISADASLRCDLNNNGTIDAGDLSQVLRMVVDKIADDLDCDLDNGGFSDGVISIADFAIVTRIVLGITPEIYN